jgi:DNA-directed RNA polymerase subunit E'/Rpb7
MTSPQPSNPFATQKKPMRRQKRLFDIYSRGLLTRKIAVPIKYVGGNLKEMLEKKISSEIEGRCIPEGYVKMHSVKLITYSSGKITNGNFISFEVVFECQICLPVEGMLIECKSKIITKAGIKAEIEDDDSPVVIFIARDHHYMTPYFSTISEDQDIKVRVIGQRFELNDKAISIIAELIEPLEVKQQAKRKPKLILSSEDGPVLTIRKKKKPKAPKLVLDE